MGVLEPYTPTDRCNGLSRQPIWRASPGVGGTLGVSSIESARVSRLRQQIPGRDRSPTAPNASPIARSSLIVILSPFVCRGVSTRAFATRCRRRGRRPDAGRLNIRNISAVQRPRCLSRRPVPRSPPRRPSRFQRRGRNSSVGKSGRQDRACTRPFRVESPQLRNAGGSSGKNAGGAEAGSAFRLLQ